MKAYKEKDHITMYRIVGQLKNGEDVLYGMNSNDPEQVKSFLKREWKKESSKKYNNIYAQSINDDSETIYAKSK